MKIGIVVGEVSGDILGAKLISMIKQHCPELSGIGIGGQYLQAEGIEILYPLDKLCVMGFTDVLAKGLSIYAIQKSIRDYFLAHPPDVFIGVDAPDFNLSLECELRQAGIKTVHFISPSIWAWRQYRIKKIRRSVDLMLVVLPFESSIYDQHNVPNCYVGHPLADEIYERDHSALLKNLNINTDQHVIALMPGSRPSEIKRLTKPLLLTAKQLSNQYNNLIFISGLVDESAKKLFLDIKNKIESDLKIDIYLNKTHEVLYAADVVVLAAGTITLEAMLLSKPMVVIGKVSFLSYLIAKLLVKIPYCALPSILAGKKMVSECIQYDCKPNKIVAEVNYWLQNPDKVEVLKHDLANLSATLRKDHLNKAAMMVINLVQQNNER